MRTFLFKKAPRPSLTLIGCPYCNNRTVRLIHHEGYDDYQCQKCKKTWRAPGRTK